MSRYKNFKRFFAIVAILAAPSVLAAEDLQVAGLAVYTDTGRDIYIAGLLTPNGQVPADVAHIAPPAAMEYRIATRRISSRGLSGTILLQSEVGSGKRATDATIDALEQLKSRIKGALSYGDQFEVGLSSAGNTTFSVNGTQLVSVDGSDVFYFILAGWVGESASTLMRDPLLAGKNYNAYMMERYESLVPEEGRVELVAGWGGAAAVKPAPKPEPKPEPKQVAAAPEPEPEAAPEPAAAPEPETVAVAEPEPEPEAAPEPVAEPKPAPEPVAMVEPTPEPAPAAEEPDPWQQAQEAVANLDDREYQRELNDYVAKVMIKVFKSVRYPKRAVRKEIQGQVEMLAEVDEKGKLLNVNLESSSGYDMLDDAAMDAIDRAGPFPALTPVAKAEFIGDTGKSYFMLIPVKFVLN